MAGFFGKTYVGFVLAVLYLPILFVALFSLNASPCSTSWEGFSLHWYRMAFQNRELLSAIWNSLVVAGWSATLACALGLLSIFLRLYQRAKPGLLEEMMEWPLFIPEMILGLSMFLLFNTLYLCIGWPETQGLHTMVMAHTTIGLAYVLSILRGRAVHGCLQFEEAALDLGARPFVVFRDVLLPSMVPSLTTAWFWAFIISFDDVVVAQFTCGPDSVTLPVYLFGLLRTGITPVINALTTLFLIMAMVGIIFLTRVLNRR